MHVRLNLFEITVCKFEIAFEINSLCDQVTLNRGIAGLDKRV